MRLHHLSITAFGPFPDTVEVDLDALSDAGLFLLAGETGAGKTTVLDAVCFALYGDVPGDRREAKRLRCDLAPEDRRPEVVLEATLRGHRYRFRRSPAWERPKKRGAGTTREQAAVVIEQLDDGGGVLTTRLDEAGDLVTTWLGMSLTQFTQVAMLPQGRFQEFLRAAPEHRQALLQQLFATARFEQVEQWLAEHRRTTRRSAEALAHQVTTTAHRFAEAADVPVPEDAVGATIDPEALEHWVATVATELEATAAQAEQDARRTAAEATRRSRALEGARALAAEQQRHAEAVEARARLTTEADEVHAMRRALDAADRAAPVRSRRTDLEEQQARVREAESAWDAARHRLAAHDHHAPEDEEQQADWLAGAGEAAHATLVRLREHRTVEADLQRRREEADRTAERVTTAEQEEESLTRQERELPDQIDAAEQAVTAAEEAGREAERLAGHVSDLERRRDAARRRDELQGSEQEQQRRCEQTTAEHQELRAQLRELTEQRLHGMAAELASSLAAGESCPVCGACEHPQPATADTGAATPEQEQEHQLRARLDDAEVTRQAHEDELRNLQLLRARAEQDAGDGTVTGLEEELHARREEHADAQRRAAALSGARQQLAERRQQHETLRGQLQQVRERLAAARAEATAASAQADELAATLRAVLDDYPDLDTRLRDAEELHDALQRAQEAHGTLRRARSDLRQRDEALAAEARHCGFATPEEATAALLAPEVAEQYRRATSAHDEECRDVERTLGEEQVRAAAGTPAPDLEALTTAADEATAQDSECQGTRRRHAERKQRADELADSLRATLSQWRPAQQQADLAAHVAALAEGKAEDNQQRMSLSAYVLAWRLTQVVAAANDRLAGMTDHRYSLVHSAEVATGQRRGGLGLVVRDEWSGEQRDPRTLSGGETFQVSLALALGLTDVVSGEAGGTPLGTLFIDEGFGTLDADALEKVMDALDDLRDAGRVVGLVSHVTELRERVPAQLVAVKTRRGSHLELAGVR